MWQTVPLITRTFLQFIQKKVVSLQLQLVGVCSGRVAFCESKDFLLNLADCLFNKNLPLAYPEESGQLEFVLVMLHSANL
jgi:hypothetical protein